MTNERDKAAEEWARPRCEGSGYVQWHNMMKAEIETFNAGWDACAKQCELFADTAKKLVAKDMRDEIRDAQMTDLRAEIEKWKAKYEKAYDSYDRHFTAMIYNGRLADKWREQAEKLAATLKNEHYADDKKALADFEAFKNKEGK